MSAPRDSQPEAGSPAGNSPDASQLDRSIVEALYQEHGDELRRLLLGILRDPQLAADVLQITFTKVLTQGHTSQEETRKAWLFRVGYHEALALLRRRNTGDKVVRKLAWSPTKDFDDADSGLIRGEVVESVRQVIATLPPDQAEVVRLRIYEEKTFAQIAAQLNIPLGTALGRMRAAIEKMRTRLVE